MHCLGVLPQMTVSLALCSCTRLTLQCWLVSVSGSCNITCSHHTVLCSNACYLSLSFEQGSCSNESFIMQLYTAYGPIVILSNVCTMCSQRSSRMSTMSDMPRYHFVEILMAYC